ncbi:MAG: hypothetical protein J6Y20_11395 [Lachnospiraceae bacterium]|nr:hypothetical protein [Lachnospiraceae bacterium]
MGFAKCYDVVSMVLEEASSRFGVLWEVDAEKQNVLKRCCEIIDSFVPEFDGIAFDVEVDEITMDIRVSLICRDIIIENSSSAIYKVIGHTKRFAIKTADEEDAVQVDFVFAGIWNKAF